MRPIRAPGRLAGVLSAAVYAVIAALFALPKVPAPFDTSFLPPLIAGWNALATVFLLLAYRAIRRRDVERHRNFIFAALAATALFLLSYVAYHLTTPSTPYGGEGLLKGVYYVLLFTHIVLAAVIVPLVLLALFRGLNREDRLHRRIVRFAFPLWLYVSVSGVLVYVLIAPYYGR
ncbi:DUF420 domain-containing protein [Hydrogenibacillus sp. N12]|uniref:DUF420 domain-containing protein n=1 Tax=Hydrogenibacillus sp. N12 TaxID=2866627 RepID=UPI001C7D9321|nr:DUF420 domain-containing protein [Hydrogenibacillus sp. N12]QZA33332.1 DUF420 domain-containing protein [Hydrogenibacillus sp. N12]